MKFKVLGMSLFFSASLFANDLKVENAFLVLPNKGSKVTAAYVDFKNESNKELQIKISSADGFKAVEMHETIHEDGRASMRRIEDLKITANQKQSLKPGGLHIMLFEPAKELKEGEKLNLNFLVNAKDYKIAFVVKARNQIVKDASEKKSEDHHEHHGHH